MHSEIRTALRLAFAAAMMTTGTFGCTGFKVDRPDVYQPELIISQLGEFAFKTYVMLSKPSLKHAQAEVAGKVVHAVSKYLKKDSTNWHVQVIESDHVFAYAFPGGGVIVSSGLLAFAKDDEGKPDLELLAVAVTHEVAHVTQQHFLKRLKRSAALMTAVVATMKSPGWNPAKGFDSQVTSGIMGVMGIGAALPFDAEQEYEADRVGAALLGPKGPAASVRFWRRMSKLPNADAFSLTHPSIYDRIERLEQQLARR